MKFTEVIRNGQMLGVHDRRNARTVSTGSMNVLGEAALKLLYNDGNKVPWAWASVTGGVGWAGGWVQGGECFTVYPALVYFMSRRAS